MVVIKLLMNLDLCPEIKGAKPQNPQTHLKAKRTRNNKYGYFRTDNTKENDKSQIIRSKYSKAII